MERSVSAKEVAEHNRPGDVWIVVDGKVYDMSRFAPDHPGGPDIIYQFAGRDATKEYSEIHPPSMISKELTRSEHIGTLDVSSVPADWVTPEMVPVEKADKPPLSALLNLNDFEEACSKTLSAKSFAFLAGASNDNLTRDANKDVYRKIWFNPRIMKNVGTVNTTSRILGVDTPLPIFIAPAGMATTAGPEGELALAAGAAATGIVQCVSTTSAYPLSEIRAKAPPGYPFFFQLYVDKDRSKTEALLRDATTQGVKAIMVTVDLPVVSKREADERLKHTQQYQTAISGAKSSSDRKGAGLARSLGSFIDPTLSWDDIAWLRSRTPLPLLLKGVQSAADAQKAMEMGLEGIVLSNHGGRALDTAPPAILTLLQLHKECPKVFGAMEVLVDGGVRRGSDVLKAICLGATGVGLGRPFMYAVNYGQEGVEHVVNIMQDELETAMRLCGISDLNEASPDLVNTAELDSLIPQSRHPYARKVVKPTARL